MVYQRAMTSCMLMIFSIKGIFIGFYRNKTDILFLVGIIIVKCFDIVVTSTYLFSFLSDVQHLIDLENSFLGFQRVLIVLKIGQC